ncbi:MAG: molybdopterin-dependent oxidoreductase [Bryobacteraceae bacterium]|nr:molybdopterin-dependent oxidoreductase [Bryobacteraceae bacterium]
MKNENPNPQTSGSGDDCQARREWITGGALLGGAFLAAATEAQAQIPAPTGAVRPIEASDYIHTTCLQCNTGCEIKVRLQDGMAVKIEGNPYGPRAMDPHIAWNTPVAQSAKINGSICGKGQAGVQGSYDPYRIVRVLKRAGARGEGKWISIPFDQAITEIVDGGALFPQDGGRTVEGLRSLYALKDRNLYSQMGADVTRIRRRQMTVAEFKDKYKDHLDTLIDPDHPDFGPKNNQLVFNWGRLKAGRSQFFSRFVKDSFGSNNAHGHTTVCQGSIYFAGKSMADQPVNGGWTGGAKFYWMADVSHSEFVIYWGAAVLEGNYGLPLKVPKITRGLASGRLKVAVVDPRHNVLASKAWRWVPVKPGEDAALALGMVRWILENSRFDRRYLENCNKAAADADGEPTWSNGAWLVKIGADGRPGKFLRASEIGLGGDVDTFVCYRDNQPFAFKSGDANNPVEGELFVDVEINGIRVKSGLQLLLEESRSHSIAEWASIAGISHTDIVALASEFTSHGKKACVEVHRGVSQHTNGFYNSLATMGALNTLIGNFDWQGGMVYSGGAYAELGGSGRPFTLGDHPAKLAPFGLDIIRGNAVYEESTIFEGYPAKRPWYPLATDVYQEVIPSAGDAYPYPIKALFLYKGSPVYALPAGHSLIPTLLDPAKIPLFVASDIVVGETTMYADYIFPDLTYLERWEFHRTHPSIVHRVSPVRQPVINSPNEKVRVYGEEMPISMEAVFLALAERLQLPGFGPGGFGNGDLKRPEDFYLRMVANVAFGDSSTGADVCPDASEEEAQIFQKARQHLDKAVFDAEKWQAAVGSDWWRKVIYVLNRGGRWWSYEQGWTGNQVRAKFGRLVNMYQERPATLKNSLTGATLSGIATYIPIADSLGRSLDHKGAPLTLITHRIPLACKSRTISNYWLTDAQPENFIEVSARDAQQLGLRDGDKARIVSVSNPDGAWDLGHGNFKHLVGTVKVTSRIRLGVISFALGYGHWAYGSSSQVIDGAAIPGDPTRATGIHANSAMMVDSHTRSPLSDVVGGSAVFYDSKVFLVKV